MGLFQGFIAVVSLVASFFCFLLCAVLLVVYPWQLLWFLPVTIGLTWWGWRKIKRATTYRFDPVRDKHLLYPPGEFADDTDHANHHVEPITPGGHMRHGHMR